MSLLLKLIFGIKTHTTDYIEKENNFRPANLAEGSPGKGFGIYFQKTKNLKLEL